MWRALVVAVLLGGAAAPALAQDAVAWDSFPIPGTPSLLSEEAGWPAPVARVRLARDLLRYAYSVPGSYPRDIGRVRASMQFLLDLDAAIQRLNLPQPLTLKPADRTRRRAWEALFDALGYELTFRGNGPVSVKSRRGESWDNLRRILDKAGITADVSGRIARGEPVRLLVPFVEVPLPLGLDTWRRILRHDFAPIQLFAWLLADRTAAMLYVGLTGLDPDTLGLFAARKPLVDAAMSNPLTFAEFASSLRVSSGRMVTPLGEPADKLWTDLVGAPPTAPDAFIQRLLTADQGRLAWFYDAVVNEPVPTQRFVLGSWLPAASQLPQFRRAYGWFRSYGTDSYLLESPFLRSTFDPELALRIVRVTDQGRALAPTSARLLNAIFEDISLFRKVTGTVAAARPEDELTASDFLEIMFRDGGDPRLRVEGYSLAQRIAARTADLSADDLAVILRGHLQFPALTITLDRMAPARAETFTAPILRAQYFRQLSNRPAAHVGLLQFQSALALFETMAAAGGLSRPAAEELCVQLSQVLPQEDGYYQARLARWLVDTAMVRLRQDAGASAQLSAEELVQLALAGRRQGLSLSTLEWQGKAYTVDPGAATLERIARVRAGQGGAPLDTLITFIGLTDAIARAPSVDELQAMTNDLEQQGSKLADAVPAKNEDWSGSDVRKALADIVKNLRRLTAPNNLNRLKGLSDDLHLVADWMTGYALLSFVYAASTATPDDLKSLGINIAGRHDLGTTRSNGAERAQLPWTLAIGIPAVYGQAWHLEGSILSLDIALAEAGRVTGGAPPINAVNQGDLIGLAESSAPSALDTPLTDAAVRRIGQSLTAARANLATSLPALAHLPGWQHAAIRWALDHEPDAVSSLLPISEMLALGDAGGPSTELDPWGSPMAPLSGCLCLQWTALPLPERLAEYADRTYLALFTVELRLRLAEIMSQKNVPAVLGPSLYALTMQKTLAAPFARRVGSWSQLIDALGRVTPEQVDELIGLLVKTPALR
jgi:hypothetical protein